MHKGCSNTLGSKYSYQWQQIPHQVRRRTVRTTRRWGCNWTRRSRTASRRREHSRSTLERPLRPGPADRPAHRCAVRRRPDRVTDGTIADRRRQDDCCQKFDHNEQECGIFHIYQLETDANLRSCDAYSLAISSGGKEWSSCVLRTSPVARVEISRQTSGFENRTGDKNRRSTRTESVFQVGDIVDAFAGIDISKQSYWLSHAVSLYYWVLNGGFGKFHIVLD